MAGVNIDDKSSTETQTNNTSRCENGLFYLKMFWYRFQPHWNWWPFFIKYFSRATNSKWMSSLCWHLCKNKYKVMTRFAPYNDAWYRSVNDDILSTTADTQSKWICIEHEHWTCRKMSIFDYLLSTLKDFWWRNHLLQLPAAAADLTFRRHWLSLVPSFAFVFID